VSASWVTRAGRVLKNFFSFPGTIYDDRMSLLESTTSFGNGLLGNLLGIRLVEKDLFNIVVNILEHEQTAEWPERISAKRSST
jgi:hypothetical protein